MTRESCQISDVTGWLFKIYPVSQEEGYFSFREMQTKPVNFIRLFPICLPILGQEVTSLYVCSIKDSHSNHSPEATILGWTPLLPAAVDKVRDLRSQRNWSFTKAS